MNITQSDIIHPYKYLTVLLTEYLTNSRFLHVGFTGSSQIRMTDRQRTVVTSIFKTFRRIHLSKNTSPFTVRCRLHHGDCINCDADAHQIALKTGIPVILHPPLVDSKRAFCQNYKSAYDRKDYIQRNHDIVDKCSILLVVPKGFSEERRSGTWATYRYAKNKYRATIIVYPDGDYTCTFYGPYFVIELHNTFMEERLVPVHKKG